MENIIKIGSVELYESDADRHYIVSLEQHGNLFVVNIEYITCWRSFRRMEFNRYEIAEVTFYAWCQEFDVRTIEEPQLDPADFDFD